jgi:hypothetical protein
MPVLLASSPPAREVLKQIDLSLFLQCAACENLISVYEIIAA